MSLPSQTPVVVTRIQNRRGTQDQFDALYPVGYLGVGGFGDPDFPGFNEANYPNVLLPGELALCTDSRRAFIGNINGEYAEISLNLGPESEIVLSPVKFSLVPSATYQTTGITYDRSPFFQILYNISDTSIDPVPTDTGVNYSSSGTMTISSTTGQTLLQNSMTEIEVVPAGLSFVSVYNGNSVEVHYKHNFPGTLNLYTATIRWISI